MIAFYKVTVGESSTLEMGRRVTAWRLTPWPVLGGWRIMSVRSVWDHRDGWDEEHEACSDVLVYPTREEANAAIALRKAAP